MVYDNINNNKNNYNIDKYIFLLFVNDEHYNLLIPKKKIILDILLEEINDIDITEKIKLLKINNEANVSEVVKNENKKNNIIQKSQSKNPNQENKQILKIIIYLYSINQIKI